MDIQKAYQRAVTALELRKYNFAISQAKEILSQNPYLSDAYWLLAFGLYGKRNYEKALSSIDKALRGRPTNIDYLCLRCAILNAQEKYQEALEVSDEALAIDPTNTSVMYWRGVALSNMGKLERAEDVTKYLLNKDPNKDYNHRLLANIYAEKKQLEDADLEFQKALELDPNNATTYNDYAVMKIDKEENKEDESIEMLKESLRLNPEDKIVQNNLKYAIDKKQDNYVTKIGQVLVYVLGFIIQIYVIYTHFKQYMLIAIIITIIYDILMIIFDNPKTKEKLVKALHLTKFIKS